MPESSIANRIAIVDDDEDVRVAVGTLLRSFGYATATFDSAEALLAAGSLAGCRCVITDLQMPGMSGIDLLVQLRRSGVDVPLIVLTAFPDPVLGERARKAGAACFLGKPFQSVDLLRCLQHACGYP